MESIIQMAMGFVAKYPIGAAALMAIGILRLVFKPTMAYIHLLADASPSLKDNELLESFERGPFYKGVAWFVDYIVSIKLPGQK